MFGATESTAAARARDAVVRAAKRTWSFDRRKLANPLSRLWNRVARIVVWTVWGWARHGLSVRAAALTYYTVFSVVPLVAATLWLLSTLHLLSSAGDILLALLPERLVQGIRGNAPLRQAAHAIMNAAAEGRPIYKGLIGVATLGYGIVRLVSNMDKALRTVMDVPHQPGALRLLGHSLLVVLAPVVILTGGLLVTAGPSLLHADRVAKLLGHIPAVGLWIAAALPFIGAWALLATIFATASNSRIPIRSAIVGGGTGAVALGVVLAAFALLQVGAKRAGVVGASMAAVPVLMLWICSSWLTVLLAAEVAVAHTVDRASPGGVTVSPAHGPVIQARGGNDQHR
ncbi:MAG TPA: YihY/virulence factor BrkB family protein [Polyangia bacterium]|nr:YihY/virulence factor BrkB family protein [Polyangia bacterium]